MSRTPSALVESVIAFLLPYFTSEATNSRDVRAEIMDTLTSYGPRNRTEFLQAARIIALTMTSLDVLAEAKTADLTPSVRIRLRNSANGLNRSTIQTEKALDKHLACDLPEAPEPPPETVHDDQPDAENHEAIEYGRAAIHAHRGRRPDTAPVSEELDERNRRIYASAMLDMLKQMGHPVQPIPPPAPDGHSQMTSSAAIPSIASSA